MIKVENTKGHSIIEIVPNNPDDSKEEIAKENMAEITCAFAAMMSAFVKKIFTPETPDKIKNDMIFEISIKSMTYAIKDMKRSNEDE